jgi:ABC-type transport system involved in cytochrome c biogenesis permease subunit
MGAAVSLFIAMLAYYAPGAVLEKGFSSPTGVVRSNFWLIVHVKTIIASYGAGALAWGLGNIALGYYLFGRYRDVGGPAADAGDLDALAPGKLAGRPQPRRRLPPAYCATLADFVYRACKLAVLLLVTGTILGALWADVSWGHFWNWDPKEVWALITLLVYMVFLHGRHTGWIGSFGMAVGAVFGLTVIIMAWYGVNYVLGGGLHSYGSGGGGQWAVGLVVLGNWLFLAAAALRYLVETRGNIAAD